MLVKELEEIFNGVIWIMADGLTQKLSETTKYDDRVIRRIDVEKEEPNSLNVWLEAEHEPEAEKKSKVSEALENVKQDYCQHRMCPQSADACKMCSIGIIEAELKRLEWYDTYYTNYVKDLEKSNHKLNDIRVEKEKLEEALEILCGMITIDSRKIGDDLFCVIINGVSKLNTKELELIKEVKG